MGVRKDMHGGYGCVAVGHRFSAPERYRFGHARSGVAGA